MKHLLFLSLLLCCSLLHAEDKAALKEISTFFEQIEQNYEAWPHYSHTSENLDDGESFEDHVWLARDDSALIRIESLNYGSYGLAKTQYFIRGDELLFMLDRVENTTPQPKAPTQVDEKRSYFAAGKLVRVLTKEGEFPAGKPTDTISLPNKTVPAEELPDPKAAYDGHTKIARAIVAKFASLDSDIVSPFASARGGITRIGDGWRLIKGSRSQDDEFALAWGVKGKANVEGESDEDGNLFLEPEAENLANYVVNLHTGAIMGTTGGSHWGDRPSLHNQYHSASWSGADTFVAQVCTGKWASMEAQVFQIIEGTKISPPADLLSPTTAAALKKLKGSPQLKAHAFDDFAISIHDVRFVQHGYAEVMQVGVSGQIPKSDEDHSSFDCTVTFKVTEGENGAAPTLTWKSTEVHPEEL